jgi:hypothetical protein
VASSGHSGAAGYAPSVRHTQRRRILTHQDWTDGTEAVLARAVESPSEAVALLRDLLMKTETIQAASMSAWHVRESRSLLAHLEHERGALATGAGLYEQAAREAHTEYRSAKAAAAWRFAEAALIRFEMGDTSKALELSGEAFSLAEPHLDPSTTYERLVAEVRRARQAEHGGT